MIILRKIKKMPYAFTVLGAVLLWGIASTHLYAQQKDYMVKTAFIKKFTLFISWPQEDIKTDRSSVFLIGYVGEKTPMYDYLEKSLKNSVVKNKKIEVTRIEEFKNIRECQLLFIDASAQNNLETILNICKQMPILTVSDTPGFAEAGVMINFIIIDEKVKFEINKTAIDDTGLYVNHLLLSIAKHIF